MSDLQKVAQYALEVASAPNEKVAFGIDGLKAFGASAANKATGAYNTAKGVATAHPYLTGALGGAALVAGAPYAYAGAHNHFAQAAAEQQMLEDEIAAAAAKQASLGDAYAKGKEKVVSGYNAAKGAAGRGYTAAKGAVGAGVGAAQRGGAAVVGAAKAHPYIAGGIAAGAAVGAGVAGYRYQQKMNQEADMAAMNAMDAVPMPEEVAAAKTAAAELYEDAMNKLAFAEALWSEADEAFVKMASDNGAGERVGIGDQQLSMGQHVAPVGDNTTMGGGQMSSGALNAFIERLRKMRASFSGAPQQ